MSQTIEKLPPGWAWAKLGEVFQIIRGVSFPSNAKGFQFENGKIACLRTANVQEEVEWGNLWFIDEKYVSRDEQVIKSKDILISTANSFELLGKVSQLKELQHRATLGTFIVNLRTLEPLNSDLFFYQLRSKDFQREVQARASTTTNISNISVGKLEQIEIKVPPHPEQTRIVEKLESLLARLARAEQGLAAAETGLARFRQSVLKAAFRAEDAEGKLKEGWRWVKLGEVANLRGGVTKGRNLEGKRVIELPYLRVANVQDGFLNLELMKTISVLESDLEKYRLLKGDVLFTEGGDKDKLGRGAIWNEEIPNCIHQNHIFRARVDSERLLPEYLTLVSKTEDSRKYFFRVAKQTTNLASINLSQLSNFEFPLPEISEQKRIVLEIVNGQERAHALETAVQTVRAECARLRQSILREAFAGRLVPQDAADEPAEALLARLRHTTTSNSKRNKRNIS